MLNGIVAQIVDLSKYFNLKEGDLLYTGTPSGVGPVKAGDKLHAFAREPGSEKNFLDLEVDII